MILIVRKKPVVVEALQWTGDNWYEAVAFSPYGLTCQRDIGSTKDIVIVDTLEGKMRCEVDDYIIKGIEGEFYPIKPDIFKQTYEIVREGR